MACPRKNVSAGGLSCANARLDHLWSGESRRAAAVLHAPRRAPRFVTGPGRTPTGPRAGRRATGLPDGSLVKQARAAGALA